LDALSASDTVLWTRLFWTWLIVRTLAWTAVAALTLWNPPTDVAEMLSWGREWSWGYHTHLPLPAWIAENSAFLAGGSLWGVYLASHVLIGVCFWAVWRLARDRVSPAGAFFAAVSLEGLEYYNYMAADLDHNVVLAATWAVAVLCFYRALRSGRTRGWLTLGVVLGFLMLSKYSAAFLLTAMLLFLTLHPATRGWWKRPGPYLALAVAMIIFAPHLIWAFREGFPPLRYAMSRSTLKGHDWVNHLWFPTYFALSQLWRLLPVVLILLPLTTWRWRLRGVAPDERFNRDFLLTLALGPFALHLGVSLVLGIEVRDLWGFQLWTFVGLVLLFLLRTRGTAWHFAWAGRLALAVASLFLVFTAGYNLLAPTLAGHLSQTHFPGKPLARLVERQCRQRFGRPLPIVASGNYFMGSSVCWYVDGRPAMCMLERPGATPWARDEDLNAWGGVILWDAGRKGDALPALFRERFPGAVALSPVELPYHAAACLQPLRIGIAFVAPPPIPSQPQKRDADEQSPR
jgi:4-amino-4-deoxy-L-arabinose transferase-like glycosyltransferase